jgi:hypothetical protein
MLRSYFSRAQVLLKNGYGLIISIFTIILTFQNCSRHSLSEISELDASQSFGSLSNRQVATDSSSGDCYTEYKSDLKCDKLTISEKQSFGVPSDTTITSSEGIKWRYSCSDKTKIKYVSGCECPIVHTVGPSQEVTFDCATISEDLRLELGLAKGMEGYGHYSTENNCRGKTYPILGGCRCPQGQRHNSKPLKDAACEPYTDVPSGPVDPRSCANVPDERCKPAGSIINALPACGGFYCEKDPTYARVLYSPGTVKVCPRDLVCPEGVQEPFRCGVNQHPNRNQTACVDPCRAQPGEYCETDSTIIKTCPAGFTCAGFENTPVVCPAGKYCPVGTTLEVSNNNPKNCEGLPDKNTWAPLRYYWSSENSRLENGPVSNTDRYNCKSTEVNLPLEEVLALKQIFPEFIGNPCSWNNNNENSNLNIRVRCKIPGSPDNYYSDSGNVTYILYNQSRIANTSHQLDASIGNLTKLVFLSLNSDDIEGTIPSELGNISTLEVLQIGGNKLSGTMPNSLLKPNIHIYIDGNDKCFINQQEFTNYRSTHSNFIFSTDRNCTSTSSPNPPVPPPPSTITPPPPPPPPPITNPPVAVTSTITVTKSGTGSGSVTATGISCGNDCSESYPMSQSSITLTATPVAGSTFSGWGGACSGTSTCSVQLNANKSVTATFNLSNNLTPPPSTNYMLTVYTLGNGSGSVTCGGISNCAGSYPAGTQKTLTATANANSSFVSWTGVTCSGGNNSALTCTITMNAAKTATATFQSTIPSVVTSNSSSNRGNLSVREAISGTTFSGDCFKEMMANGTNTNFAQCRLPNTLVNRPGTTYNFPKTVTWNNLILKFRFAYMGINNDRATAYNQANCISNPTSFSYNLGSGANLPNNTGTAPMSDPSTGITIPATANTCVNLNSSSPLYNYGVRSYKLTTNLWADSQIYYAYFKPGETFNYASGSESSCNQSIDPDAYASGIRCRLGGGCALNGKSPSASNPSANPSTWGSCYQLKSDCYSRNPVDWVQCYQIAPQ